MQGSGIDSSLNELGLAQAKAFYDKYQSLHFDKIYTSSLKRSIQSVDSFIQQGTLHEAHDGLNEISWGSKEGTKITLEEDEYYHWLLKQWQAGNTSVRIEGGESPEDVASRQRPVLDSILSRSEESSILICMHGRAIRVLLCQMLNYPLSAMDVFEHTNLGLYLLSYSGSFFKVETYNNADHLKNVKEALAKKD